MIMFFVGVIGNVLLVCLDFVVVVMGLLFFDGLLGIDFFKIYVVYLDFVIYEMCFKFVL